MSDVRKSKNLNFRNEDLNMMSTVWLFDANNNFKMTVGPSMVHERFAHGCGIYHSSVHLGRPVIIAAGSHSGEGRKSSEIWDFTVPGSQWYCLSKYSGLFNKQTCAFIFFCKILACALLFDGVC